MVFGTVLSVVHSPLGTSSSFLYHFFNTFVLNFEVFFRSGDPKRVPSVELLNFYYV